jgi:hypothetical protein
MLNDNQKNRMAWLQKNRPNDPQLQKLQAKRPGKINSIPVGPQPGQQGQQGMRQSVDDVIHQLGGDPSMAAPLAGGQGQSMEDMGMVRAPDGVNWTNPNSGATTLMGAANMAASAQGTPGQALRPQLGAGFQPAPRPGAVPQGNAYGFGGQMKQMQNALGMKPQAGMMAPQMGAAQGAAQAAQNQMQPQQMNQAFDAAMGQLTKKAF